MLIIIFLSCNVMTVSHAMTSHHCVLAPKWVPSLTFKHNINIPDIIIKIMPGASLWHRKGHVSGHSTRSLGRGQTPHSGFTKRNSCQQRRLQREKILNVSCSNHGWGCNVMLILIFVNCDTKIACLGKLDRSNLPKPAVINALKTP